VGSTQPLREQAPPRATGCAFGQTGDVPAQSEKAGPTSEFVVVRLGSCVVFRKVMAEGMEEWEFATGRCCSK